MHKYKKIINSKMKGMGFTVSKNLFGIITSFNNKRLDGFCYNRNHNPTIENNLARNRDCRYKDKCYFNHLCNITLYINV